MADNTFNKNRREIMQLLGGTGAATMGLGTASAADGRRRTKSSSPDTETLTSEKALAEFEHALDTEEVQSLHDTLKEKGLDVIQEKVTALKVQSQTISEALEESESSSRYAGSVKSLNPVSVFAHFKRESSEKRALLNAIVVDDPDTGDRVAAGTWAYEYVPELDEENENVDVDVDVLGVKSNAAGEKVSAQSGEASTSVVKVNEMSGSVGLDKISSEASTESGSVSAQDISVDLEDVLTTGACLALMGAICNAASGSVGVPTCLTACTAAGIPIAIVGCDVVCILAVKIIQYHGCSAGSAALCAAAGLEV